MSSYGNMYPYYSQQQQYMVAPEHQGPPKQQQPGNDYTKSSKDPPLDLMTKPQQQPQSQQQPLDGSLKDTSSAGAPQGQHNSGNVLPNTLQPTKPISHYYPYK